MPTEPAVASSDPVENTLRRRLYLVQSTLKHARRRTHDYPAGLSTQTILYLTGTSVYWLSFKCVFTQDDIEHFRAAVLRAFGADFTFSYFPEVNTHLSAPMAMLDRVLTVYYQYLAASQLASPVATALLRL